MLRHNLKRLAILIFVTLGLSGCHKDSPKVDFYSTYNNIAGNTDYKNSFAKAVRESKNYSIQKDIKQKIDKAIETDADINIEYTIKGDKYTLDLTDNVVFESVDVKVAGKEFRWDESNFSDIFKTDFVSFNNSIGALEITVNSHVEYEQLLNDQLQIVKNYIFNFKRPEFTFENGELKVIKNSKNGQDADIEKFESEFKQLVDSKESGSITVDVVTTYSDITEEEIEAINTMMSTFTTYYSPSASRGGNIRVATSRLDGILLAPGEEISIDKKMLSRNAVNGYFKAGSYLNGKTVQTYGGGICQVSSTLYGAILRAGIIPIERNAHSMAVNYVPLGLDAAISEGYKDLKIKNTYDSPIYIEGHTNGNSVTFRLYGKEGLMEGYTYKPINSASKNGLYANSWLQKIKDGEVVEKIHLFESNYRPHN